MSNNKDNTVALSLTLPIHSTTPLLTAVVISLVTHKEHSTSARIKAVYMLKDKKSPSMIQAATIVTRSVVYRLMAVAKERGWREGVNMPLEVSHVLNALRSG